MHFSCNRLQGVPAAGILVLVLALFAVAMAVPKICNGQDMPPNTTRKAQRFTFSFEPDETVDMEFTADAPEDEPARPDEFLKLNIFSGRTPISSSEFNLARLRLVRITAVRTGFGNAELFINRMLAGVVPIRRNRIYLQAQMLVNITVRDFQTDQLTLIPSETTLKGLMTFIDQDGTRSTRTIVASTVKVPVAEAN